MARHTRERLTQHHHGGKLTAQVWRAVRSVKPWARTLPGTWGGQGRARRQIWWCSDSTLGGCCTYGTVWLVLYGMMWYGTVRYSTVWYGWCGMLGKCVYECTNVHGMSHLGLQLQGHTCMCTAHMWMVHTNVTSVDGITALGLQLPSTRLHRSHLAPRCCRACAPRTRSHRRRGQGKPCRTHARCS